MRADETEKDWKGRCFNEQPRYVQYTRAAWAQLGVAADVWEWAWA